MDIFIFNLILFIIYILVRYKKILHQIQQNNYNTEQRYLIWWYKNKFKFVMADKVLFTLLFLSFVLVYLIPNQIPFIAITFSLFLFTTLFLYLQDQKKNKFKEKKPLVITARVKRIITVSLLLNALIVYSAVILNNINPLYTYTYLTIFAFLEELVIFTSVFLLYPVERLLYYKFWYLAKKKLNSYKEVGMEVIGITGSYGKTSSKNILNDILNVKFQATPSPQNYNTPFGLMKTIHEKLSKFDNYFIAEMGAYHVGEIKENCKLVEPKYGILTKIGTAHLEQFGSQANIQKTKFELIESLPSDGVGILNKDDELQVSYKLKNNVPIIWIGIYNKTAEFVALNIKASSEGMTFDVRFPDLKKYSFQTKILGEANIYNLLAGIALGHHLGLTPEELQKGVKLVKATEHRLEIKNRAEITYIDDAYNSNPIGAKMALDVLNLMPGKKIIVTPGMIELGKEQYNSNFTFGTQIAAVCDIVILVGKEQTKPIQEGLKEAKFDMDNLFILNDVKEAFPIVNQVKGKEETYVLLENDLPDIFNE